MAKVFLSYDREDGAKARVIAQALERAGHFVWYDMHIKGGAEYGREIEAALEKSDVVVVLWSKESVASAWVRDEAAAGRDKGGLVPVLLEAVTPPMGFRQYQNLDFSGWKGRGKPPRLDDLLDSVAAIGPNSADQNASLQSTPKSKLPKHVNIPLWAGIAVGTVALLVAVGLFVGLVLNRKASSALPVVAVQAADRSEASKSLTRELLVRLGSLENEGSQAIQLATEGASANPDLTFQVSGTAALPDPHANVVLLDSRSANLLWSGTFDPKTKNPADLKQQIAFTAGRALRCAAEALGSSELPKGLLKTYLTACISLEDSGENELAIKLMRQVKDKAPRFQPALRTLLIVDADLYTYADAAELPALRRAMEQDIIDARAINPTMAEASLAEAILLPGSDFSGRIRLATEALKAEPGNPWVLNQLAGAYQDVGQSGQSVNLARQVAAADPLSPIAFNSYFSSLLYAGRTEAAKQALADAEKTWPDSTSVTDARYRLHLRFGNPSEALRMQDQGIVQGGPLRDAYLKARLDPAQIDHAVAVAMSAYRQYGPYVLGEVLQVLGEFNRNDELYQLLMRPFDERVIPEFADVLFRPGLRGFRKDPRFMQVAKRFGLTKYWLETGEWPDFCSEPDLPYDCKKEAAKLH